VLHTMIFNFLDKVEFLLLCQSQNCARVSWPGAQRVAAERSTISLTNDLLQFVTVQNSSRSKTENGAFAKYQLSLARRCPISPATGGMIALGCA
jgi:hypothetical protein